MLPRLSDLSRNNTHRLIPSRYSDKDDTVLTRLTDDPNDLNALFELEGATNDRLLGEAGLLPGISVRELIFGLSYSHISTRPSRIPATSETVSAGQNGALGMRGSPFKPRRSKSPITRVRNCRKSSGSRKRFLSTSISSLTSAGIFTIFARIAPLKIAWTRTAMPSHNRWPGSFWKQDQAASFIPVSGTRPAHASRASGQPW